MSAQLRFAFTTLLALLAAVALAQAPASPTADDWAEIRRIIGARYVEFLEGAVVEGEVIPAAARRARWHGGGGALFARPPARRPLAHAGCLIAPSTVRSA
jgi:hypothetical protein